MTRTIVQEAVEAQVRRLGWRPGTSLENAVALELSRWEAGDAEQQYTIGRFRVDFAWPDRKIALEADGWWHRSPEGASKDRLRDSWLRSQGWIVFRVDDEHGPHALADQVQRVARIIRAHPVLPKPPPEPRRGGCQAMVPDYDYEEHERPCANRAAASGRFCHIHARGRS